MANLEEVIISENEDQSTIMNIEAMDAKIFNNVKVNIKTGITCII